MYLPQITTLNCVPCKLLEHIVCSDIMAHLNEHNLMSDRQHAIRKKRSCETQLITIINDWAKILKKPSTHPRMNYSNVNYMGMVLVGITVAHYASCFVMFCNLK